MKRNFLLTVISIFLLASCGSANKPVEVSNDVTGFDTGIPSVELTTVYSGSESTRLWNSISLSLDNIASVKTNYYGYQLILGKESSLNETTKLSFFGQDKQYGVKEVTSEKVEKLGKAVTSTTITKSKSEYATGDKGKLTYIRNTNISASGEESTSYSHNYYETGRYDIRKTLLSGTVSLYESNGILGSTKEGRLYYVHYYETISHSNAYNDSGETVKGLFRTYYHTLYDLNTVTDPRFSAVYRASIGETDIDVEGVKTSSFYISGKYSSQSIFGYEIDSKGDEKRIALIDSYPSEIMKDFRVHYYLNGQLTDQIILAQDPSDESRYSSRFTPFITPGAPLSFYFSATRTQIDKQSESVFTENIHNIMPISTSILLRGNYPEDFASVYDNNITLQSAVEMKLTFQSSQAEPYLSIVSIELL